jgi:hypothetical protein
VRKAEAILGALRSGVLHVLVTDEDTAREVLRLDDEDRERDQIDEQSLIDAVG